MAILFADGFDSGEISLVLAGSSELPEIIDAPSPRTGKVLYFPYLGKANISLATTTSFIVLHFNIYFVNAIAAQQFLYIYNSSGIYLGLSLDADKKIKVYTPAATLGTGSTVFTYNTWYNIQIKIAVSNSLTAGQGKVLVNGVTEIDLAAGTDTCYSGNQDIDRLLFESISAVSAFYIDDIILQDSNGDLYADADLRVGTLVPNAVGDSTQGTVTGASTNYGAMNTSESSYVTFDGTDKDLYNLPAPVALSSIKGIVLASMIRNGNVVPIIKTGSIEYDQSRHYGDVSFTPNRIVLETNPNTSIAWSSSDLASLQIGVKP